MQERYQWTRIEGNISHVHVVNPTREHASNGGTGPLQYHKITKKRGTVGNKHDEGKKAWKTRREDVPIWQATKGKSVECLEINFGRNKYGIQFINTEKNN